MRHPYNPNNFVLINELVIITLIVGLFGAITTSRWFVCRVCGSSERGLYRWSAYWPQTTVSTTTGTVAIDDNDTLLTAPIALHYGTPNDTPGISFENTMAITNGSIQWLQVIDYEYESLQRNNGSWIYKSITNALDNGDPYPSYTNDINATADSPGFGPAFPSYFQTLSRSDDFNMWLEFKPDGGIWVPLRVVNWDTSLGHIGQNDRGGGNVQINPDLVFTECGTDNPNAQTFVNILAHEGIWGNVGKRSDDASVPIGDIASGTCNAFLQYTVAPSSRTILRSAVGF